MAEALVKEIEIAAGAAAANQSTGQWWARCPQGKIMRIRGIGVTAYGTGAVVNGAPKTDGFKFEIKADQRPMCTLNAPLMYIEEAIANTAIDADAQNEQILDYHLIDSVIPINDILTPGEELNIYATTPASGECSMLLLMQLVDLAEVR